MSKCKKTAYDSMEEGSHFASIYTTWKKNIKEGIRFRPYKCKKCGKVHLTTKSKEYWKLMTNEEYRYSKELSDRVKTEAEYWINKLKKPKKP